MKDYMNNNHPLIVVT